MTNLTKNILQVLMHVLFDRTILAVTIKSVRLTFKEIKKQFFQIGVLKRAVSSVISVNVQFDLREQELKFAFYFFL